MNWFDRLDYEADMIAKEVVRRIQKKDHITQFFITWLLFMIGVTVLGCCVFMLARVLMFVM